MSRQKIDAVQAAIFEDMILDEWGESGQLIILECRSVENPCRDFDDFLDYCVDCGDQWGLTLLTGISKLFPGVYDALPHYLGRETWGGILPILRLCGINPK